MKEQQDSKTRSHLNSTVRNALAMSPEENSCSITLVNFHQTGHLHRQNFGYTVKYTNTVWADPEQLSALVRGGTERGKMRVQIICCLPELCWICNVLLDFNNPISEIKNKIVHLHFLIICNCFYGGQKEDSGQRGYPGCLASRLYFIFILLALFKDKISAERQELDLFSTIL